MFTPPPPSPGLHLSQLNDLDSDASFSQLRTPIEDPEHRKKPVGRQTRWTILLVPFVLIAITASTRYLTHPAVFDLFSKGPGKLTWGPAELGKVHQRHERAHEQRYGRRDGEWSTTLVSTASEGTSLASGEPLATRATATGTGTDTPSAVSPTTTFTNTQPIPTIPSSPPTLPTPFPQPLSANLPGDNMSISCLNFFNNMTNSLPFRECRPFSLLLQSSQDFIEYQQAEKNLTLLNNVVWGTCNTTPGKDQCVKNMQSFADQLQGACQRELQTKVQPIPSETLAALQAYSLMYDAACTLINPTTNSYCFVNAAASLNASDVYLYQLPIGGSYPSNTPPSCSSCSKDLLNLYWTALANKTEALTTLASTYNSGAKAVNAVCNSHFAALASAATSHKSHPFVKWSFIPPSVLGLWWLRTLL